MRAYCLKREARMSQNEGQRYERLLTVAQVAKILAVDKTTVGRWIRNGDIEAVELPGSRTKKHYRIKRSTVDAILNKERREQ
jgi:excisionase family DNA binding protein